MKTGYTAKNCDKKCRKCYGNHHQVICFKASSESKIEKTVTATSKGEVKVMLQTARAYAFGEDKSKGVMVNVLLDGGSQKSYITEQLAKKLPLNTENVEQLHVNTFGSEKFEQKKCNVVTVNLKLADNSEIAISALSYPVICSPISSSVDVSEFPHLRSLSLADSPSTQERRIDMLIGMNYYYQIVTGEVVNGKSGPVAVNSKLGWLLSGPYDVYSDNKVRTSSNVSSHLILNCSRNKITDEVHENIEKSTEIQDALKSFWQHEALGIADLPPENPKATSLDQDSTLNDSEFDIKFNG